MTVNKALKKLYKKGKLRLADRLGDEILIEKNPKGGWIVYWLDMFYNDATKEYYKTSDLRSLFERIKKNNKLKHPMSNEYCCQ